MIAVQHQLTFARPLSCRVRSVRRPFRPARGEGTYRLPHDVRDRLSAALAPFRNRDAAFALAAFLARFHSNPDRLVGGFMVDRRELADRPDLALTEARVRGAINALEAIGYLERGLSTGSTHKATEEGLRRKPIRFVFGSEYAPLFMAANKRARRAKGRAKDSDRAARRALTPSPTPRLSATLLEGQRLNSPLVGDFHAQRLNSPLVGDFHAQRLNSPLVGRSRAPSLNSPKPKSEADNQVNLGELRERSGPPAQPSQDSALERALHNLQAGVFGKPRGFPSEGGE
jgi:hypothetical protein